MYRLSLKVIIALTTFIIGVAAVTYRIAYRTPLVRQREEPACVSSPFDQIPQSDWHVPYFPDRTLHDDETGEYSLTNWYARSLKAMREPPFRVLIGSDVDVYRFLWLRSFHPAVSIRAWREGNSYCLNVKQLDGVDKYIDKKFITSDKLAVNQTRQLSADEWGSFRNHLDEARFWSMQSAHDAPLANDGAFWVLEGLGKHTYHVVERQSPQEGTYREMCVYLLRLSGLDIKDDEVY